MLSISPIADLAYYLDLCAEDYFLNGGEPPGKWCGGAAAELGLTGMVKPEEFRKLFIGFHPHTGAKLVQNAGSPNRRPGFDFTFSAPKSVSLIWALADRESQELIQSLHQAAVIAALEHAERHLAYSRTGQAGKGELKHVRLVAATFEHGTSRAEDPQLHTHALIANVGLDEVRSSRSLLSPPLFHSKKLLGAFYRAELARMLRNEFGFSFERYGDSFHVLGVDHRATDNFSKRRKEILARVGKNASAKAAEIAALDTRRTKENVPPRSVLFERWREEYEQLRREDPSLPEFSISALAAFCNDALKVEPRPLLQKAATKLLRRASHFSAEDFYFESLCAASEFGLDAGGVLLQAQEFLELADEVIRLDLPDGSLRFTSLDILKAEKQLLDTTFAMLHRVGALTNSRLVSNTLARHAHLSDEQSKAVHQLLASKSSVRFLHGLAGTGKTSHVLKACVEAWQAQGYEVIGSAPTGRAAVQLEESAGIPTETNHALLGDYDPSFGYVAKHHLKQLVRAAPGKRTYRYKNPRPREFHSKQILVVDEAGMVNLRHFQMLLDQARKGDATVVFIGDPNQLMPVEGTAPFLSLSQRCGYSELKDIRRQHEEWARDAARYFARGEPGKGLALYAEHNQIRFRESHQDAIEEMVLDWVDEALTTPERAVILCSTNVDCQTANALCQQKSIDAGWLNPTRSVTVEDVQQDGQVFESTIHVGDRVLFTRNSKKYGVENGTLGDVTALDRIGRKLVVRLDNGKTVRIPLRKYSHVRLGYALTTYRAQGATFEHAYVLVGGNMQDSPTTYVQATRARERTTFYGDQALIEGYLENIEESPLARQMARRPDLTMAADLLRPPEALESDRDQLLETLIHNYLEACSTQGKNALIVVQDNQEAVRLNQRCHQLLRAGHVPPVRTGNGLDVVPGDRVLFKTPPYMSTSIRRGERATVVAADASTGLLSFVFDDHKPLQKQETYDLLADRANLAYAHALTPEEANHSARNVQSVHRLQDNSNSPVSLDYYSSAQDPTSLYCYQQPQLSTNIYGPSIESYSSSPYQPVQSTWGEQYTKQYNYAYQAAGQLHWNQQMYAANQQFYNYNAQQQTQTQTQYQSQFQTNAFGQTI